jgi:predicted RNA-binding Zn ribbon-like protein
MMRVTPAGATAGRPPFKFLGGSLALDFVNTVGNWLDPAARRDYFQSKADVLEWMTLAGLSRPGATLRASATMLEGVRSTPRLPVLDAASARRVRSVVFRRSRQPEPARRKSARAPAAGIAR